eukprot:354847-Prymnesium_polylepis.1
MEELWAAVRGKQEEATGHEVAKRGGGSGVGGGGSSGGSEGGGGSGEGGYDGRGVGDAGKGNEGLVGSDGGASGGGVGGGGNGGGNSSTSLTGATETVPPGNCAEIETDKAVLLARASTVGLSISMPTPSAPSTLAAAERDVVSDDSTDAP